MSQAKIVLAYDGTSYLGWQKTKMGQSIEEALEKALFSLLGNTPSLQAASRTDAGVHAEGQIVSFPLASSYNLMDLQASLTSLLPADIAIRNIEFVEDSFHPTTQSIGKKYHYDVCTSSFQSPFYRHFSWHFFHPLDLMAMEYAAKQLVGVHDFSAFCNQRPDLKEDKIRQIFSIEIIPLKKDRIRFVIHGNRFLYKMVRNIVGTLLYIGCGKLNKDSIPKLLQNKDRKQIGMTAPAHGLFLKEVFY